MELALLIGLVFMIFILAYIFFDIGYRVGYHDRETEENDFQEHDNHLNKE